MLRDERDAEFDVADVALEGFVVPMRAVGSARETAVDLARHECNARLGLIEALIVRVDALFEVHAAIGLAMDPAIDSQRDLPDQSEDDEGSRPLKVRHGP